MANASPSEHHGTAPIRDRYRIVLRRGPHRWIFSFTAADAGAVLARVAELVRDEVAPFDESDALLVRREVARIGAGPRPVPLDHQSSRRPGTVR